MSKRSKKRRDPSREREASIVLEDLRYLKYQVPREGFAAVRARGGTPAAMGLSGAHLFS
jgi:hypothetical protein